METSDGSRCGISHGVEFLTEAVGCDNDDDDDDDVDDDDDYDDDEDIKYCSKPHAMISDTFRGPAQKLKNIREQRMQHLHAMLPTCSAALLRFCPMLRGSP